MDESSDHVLNVRAIRAALGMSQSEFANAFRIPLQTLKGWEQGRRRPDTTATAYLTVISAMPDEAKKALAAPLVGHGMSQGESGAAAREAVAAFRRTVEQSAFFTSAERNEFCVDLIEYLFAPFGGNNDEFSATFGRSREYLPDRMRESLMVQHVAEILETLGYRYWYHEENEPGDGTGFHYYRIEGTVVATLCAFGLHGRTLFRISRQSESEFRRIQRAGIPDAALARS